MTELEKETEIRWIKHESGAQTSLMGKDVVVFATERFIKFMETLRPDKKEILYNANSEVKGDGVHCICTHGSLNCFAFSEMCRNPRILVMSYPSFETIKSFDSVTDTNYVALRFSEMEFLVALTGIPDYKLVIWNWRTSEKLYVKETKIASPSQIIRVSPTSPVQIIQSTGQDRRLLFWNMSLCHKKTLLNSTYNLLPPSAVPPYAFAYGADGDIYVADYEGSLYSRIEETANKTSIPQIYFQINPDTHVCSQQYSSSRVSPPPEFVPCMTWHKGGIVFATPTEILFLRRKSPEGWLKVWSVIPKVPFVKLLSSILRDLLVGVTIWNEVIVFKGESPVECVTVKSYGGNFEFVCFVNPLGDFFVTFGNLNKEFHVWHKTNGQRVSQLPWTGERINAVESSPKWPYLVATTANGWVHIISLYEPNQPMVLDSIRLTENSLDAIRFRGQGTQFCVANMDLGEFFLLKVPAKVEVIAHVKLDLKIVDYTLPEKEVNTACLFIVPMSQLCCRSGQTIFLYALNEKRKNLMQVKDIALPNVVTEIRFSPKGSNELLCVPHRSRKIFAMNILNGKVVREYVSGHQMKFLTMQCLEEFLITFGTDGLVIVKLDEGKTCATLFSSHHRLAKGIRTLAVDPYLAYAIAVGETGSLVCVYLKKLENTNRRPEFEALMSSPTYKQLFLPPKMSFQELDPESANRIVVSTWLEIRERELVYLEEQQSKKEKQSILEELYEIRSKLQELLNENLSNPTEKQLPIDAFDLDKTARRKKLEDAKAEREKEKQFTLATMKSLNKVSDIIKKECWESVAVKGRQIQGILAPISVQSYALFAESKSANLKMTWLTETKKIEQLFKMGDTFEPWIPRTDSNLERHINFDFRVSTLDVVQTIRTKYDEEQMEDEKTDADLELEAQKYVWSGTSTHNFVEVDPKHCSQFELTTFLQSHQEIQIIENDIRKVMLWFNKEFAEVFELKEKEMEFLADRNNRFRHMIKELSFFNFSPAICKTQIYDPEWAPEEDPETIMRVQDKEITVPMYISDSEMELIQKKKAEEDRLRQLLMSDDFKEKALMVMMDGVLEKLWEDEIKKDPPKPKCMVDKNPETWSEDDLKAIRAYEEAVKFVNIERERYRKILEGKWTSTIVSVKDSVAKFDEKVAKLHLLKLKVESAVGQEILKGLRIRKKCLENIELQRKRETIKLNLAKNEKKIESMSVELNKLQDMLNECRNVYEGLQNKDRNLDKNFKREFPEYSPVICEQLYKLSKKRPRLVQKAAIYSTVLNDLGKCAVSGTKPDYMPIECIQYLKDIDALDPYSNAPASVSQQSWELACKLRRAKIDTELKIRACAIDVADAEATVAAFHKSLKAAKEYQSQLQGDLQSVSAEKINSSLNFPLQLVLKKGLVEIPLSGHISDFNECVLVTKDILKEVNGAIQKIGEQKINAMKKAANFRKGIIYKEWEHKKLRMEIEDLKGQLETIEKLEVLKELQAILVARARGFSDEKGFLYLENELAKVKETFQKTEIEVHRKIEEFDQKIDKMNASNRELDLKIIDLNIEVNEMNLGRDRDYDKKIHEENMKRMKKIREKGSLVRKIQRRHNEILHLQTELELLRLKTFPTIKYKIS